MIVGIKHYSELRDQPNSVGNAYVLAGYDLETTLSKHISRWPNFEEAEGAKTSNNNKAITQRTETLHTKPVLS